jgi:hypothetical protein
VAVLGRRRAAGLALAAATLLPIGCTGGEAAAPAQPTEAPPQPTQAPAYQAQVQVTPSEPRLGTDENVVLRITFRSRDNRPVSGAQPQAVVNYPGGPMTITGEQTTFQDGRVDLAIPVQPQGRQVPRNTQVRVELVMKYQGQDYRANTGFTVR